MQGCGGGNDDLPAAVGTTPGTFSLSLIDAPVEDVAEVWIEFDGVSVDNAAGETITFDLDPAVSVDLLTLTDGVTQTLVDQQPL